MFPLLDTVNEPAALARLDGPETRALAAEIRKFLIEKVSRTGGHLGPNLGVVELTIAMHRVLDSPKDVLLFDTGHQAYVHKILTGRRAGFDRLRRAGGLSGYPSRAESEHDFVENSHASAALSHADGLAKALAVRGEHDRKVVAVVGDGALTGGMCWEALNNIGGAPQRPVIVVLNDNGRSYEPTVGGLAAHLTQLRAQPPASPQTTMRTVRANVFQNLGLAYLGPIDGHDIAALEDALRVAVSLHRPVLVHCVTHKGNGYGPAEADLADHMHAVGVLDPATGKPAKPRTPTWTSVFADEIVKIGQVRPDVVCVTAAMMRPVGLYDFATRYPHRTFDVGIAEQHAVASAAGLARGGMHPVVAVYATFANRAFDQVLMDVALHRLPVTFVLDRAGITGDDGPSHHGMWDLSIMPAVPGLRIAAPRDAATLRLLLREAVQTSDGPTMIRFPKANAWPNIPAVDNHDGLDVLHIPRRRDVLIAACGPLAAAAIDAATTLAKHNIGATVVDPRWVYPVTPSLARLASRHRLVLSLEDNERTGGFGAHLAQTLPLSGVPTPVRSLGLPGSFVEHGRRDDILIAGGLDAASIAAAVARLLPTRTYRRHHPAHPRRSVIAHRRACP